MKEKQTPNMEQMDKSEEKSVREAFDKEVSPELRREMRTSLDGFKNDLREHSYVRQMEKKSQTSWFSVFSFQRLALAAGSGAVCLLIVAMLMVTSQTPSWAEVVERFDSMPFVFAAIYVKEAPLEDPKEYDLWMDQGGKARVRTGHQVIFGKNGDVVDAFDVVKRSTTSADSFATDMIRALGTPNEFSLETALRVIMEGTSVELAPSNDGTPISKDMVVYDLASGEYTENVRIWALCESKLPVRILIWEPWSGKTRDIVLTYSMPQSDNFFDASAFAGNLNNYSLSDVDLAYSGMSTTVSTQKP